MPQLEGPRHFCRHTIQFSRTELGEPSSGTLAHLAEARAPCRAIRFSVGRLLQRPVFRVKVFFGDLVFLESCFGEAERYCQNPPWRPFLSVRLISAGGAFYCAASRWSRTFLKLLVSLDRLRRTGRSKPTPPCLAFPFGLVRRGGRRLLRPGPPLVKTFFGRAGQVSEIPADPGLFVTFLRDDFCRPGIRSRSIG